MASPDLVDDARAVEPIGYIRAVGLRPEDCYGFLPINLGAGTYAWLYRDRPEYEGRRVKLPGPETSGFDLPEIGSSAPSTSDLPSGALGESLAGIIAQAQAAQAAYAGTVPGGPDEPESSRTERIEKLKEGGAISAAERAAGRKAWAEEMDGKGRWPEPIAVPGVAGPGSAAFEDADLEVEKDRWPRSKLVMRKRGSDLGEALREKIAKWGCGPEDSFGHCPYFDNSAIYFGWRKS